MKTPNKKTPTIESAAIEIISKLGGKTHKKNIDVYVIQHVKLTGNTPTDSISCTLQRSKFIVRSPDEPGWWQLKDYKTPEELVEIELKKIDTKLRQEVKELLQELAEIRERIDYYNSNAYRDAEISRMAKNFMNECQNKDRAQRDGAVKLLNYLAINEDVSFDSEALSMMKHFDEVTPPPPSHTTINNHNTEYRDGASSHDIVISGLSGSGLNELLSQTTGNSTAALPDRKQRKKKGE